MDIIFLKISKSSPIKIFRFWLVSCYHTAFDCPILAPYRFWWSQDDPISNDPILMISATFLLKIAIFPIISRFFKKVFTGFHECSGLLKVGFLNFSNSADTHWIIYLLTVMFCTDLYANCRTYILYLPHLKTQCRHLTHFAWVMRSRFSDYHSSFYLRDTLLSKWHSRMSLKVWNFRRNIPNIILKWYEKRGISIHAHPSAIQLV